MKKITFTLFCTYIICAYACSKAIGVTFPSDTTMEAFIKKSDFIEAIKAKKIKAILDKTGEHYKKYAGNNYKKVFDSNGDIKRDAAIIIIFNPVNQKLLDETKVKKIVCSRGKDDTGKIIVSTDDYLLAKKNILLVFIEKTVNADALKVDLKDSYFEKSFSELKDMALAAFGAGEADSYRGRIVSYGRKDIKAPCVISVNVPCKKPLATDTLYNKNLSVTLKSADQDVDLTISPSQFKLNFDDTEVRTLLNLNYQLAGSDKSLQLTLPKYYFYKDDKINMKQEIHEKNYLVFSLGGSLSKLSVKQFSLKNDTVNVSLDSTQKQTWKANLLVGLELYPFGRDIDHFMPIWKSPFKKFYERLGIMGGIKLSKDPLSSYYYGLCLSLSKGLTATIGFNYTNQYPNQAAYLPNIGSVTDAKDYLKREYERNIYFGIFFSPSQMAKLLGIIKK